MKLTRAAMGGSSGRKVWERFFKGERAMKNLTDAQQRFIEQSRVRAEKCAELGAEADRLGLPILAREWDYLSKTLSNAIGNQQRAFRDDSLSLATHSDNVAPPGAQKPAKETQS